jgi:hypothetical protein
MEISGQQKQTWSYVHLDVEHIWSSGITLWHLGKEGKEKQMISQQYWNALHLCS